VRKRCTPILAGINDKWFPRADRAADSSASGVPFGEQSEDDLRERSWPTPRSDAGSGALRRLGADIRTEEGAILTLVVISDEGMLRVYGASEFAALRHALGQRECLFYGAAPISLLPLKSSPFGRGEAGLGQLQLELRLLLPQEP
jgi:hypothetical protein